MNTLQGYLVCAFVACLCIVTAHSEETYTDTWAVHIEGGEDFARTLIEKHGFSYIGEILPDHYHVQHRHVSKRSIHPSPQHHESLSLEPEVRWLEQQVAKKRVKRDLYNDPKWPHMWYLKRGEGLDMNVIPAWEKGYRGKGVVVSILDDGIEKDHPDLKTNYDPKASYDVNANDPDPQPRYDYTNENRHGTRCAGEVAAEANNGICSIGVAYEAGIGGVRMLDGDVTDAVEAKSLSLNPQHIDIYSASWGPDDDGRTVDGPASLAKKAFQNGIQQGRGGKGSIFVWASGNGGRSSDSCNCDGYTNSVYTISISSATEKEVIPWYSEPCSSTLASTYSSGSSREHQIVTTDLRKQCTESHTGTSASAPLAAGICALALSANPELTWRDLQHIVVMTARPSDLHASDWVTNGVGKKVSHSFGFGLMDASAMVDLALNWTNVPQQHRCEIKSTDAARAITVNGKVTVSLQSDGCRGTNNEVMYLEHVQAVVSLTANRRGQVTIYLTSPQGTKSTLLPKRTRDSSPDGFTNWAFMTTHSWGEISTGTWKLEIDNDGTSSTLKNWSLIQFGTATDPLSGQSAQHPYSHSHEECKPDRSKIMGNICVKDCPVSFYAATQSTGSGSTIPATTTTTAAKSTIGQPPTPVNADWSTLATPTASPANSIGSDKTNDTITQVVSNPVVTVNNTATTVLVCEPCATGCATCSAPEPEFCSECLHGYSMNSDNICEQKTMITSIKDSLAEHPKSTIVLVVIALCVISVAVFFLVFAFLQLKDSNMCLNKPGMPLFSKSNGRDYSQLSASDSDFENEEKYTLNGNHESMKVQISRPGDFMNGLPVTNLNGSKGVAAERRALLSDASDDEVTTFQMNRDIPGHYS